MSTWMNSCCGCLRPPCGGTMAMVPSMHLEQRLLHALAGHVARDRRVVGLRADLVDLVDVDDAGLRLLDVVVALLQQLLDDVLDVLADVARLGERRGVGDREGHVQQPRQRLGQQRLAAAGRADQQDVALGELDLVALALAAARLQPLVVVVDRDREHLLGAVLADHVLVEDVLDLVRLGQLLAGLRRLLLELLANDVVAQLDAFVADEDRRDPRSACAPRAGSCRRTSSTEACRRRACRVNRPPCLDLVTPPSGHSASRLPRFPSGLYHGDSRARKKPRFAATYARGPPQARSAETARAALLQHTRRSGRNSSPARRS